MYLFMLETVSRFNWCADKDIIKIFKIAKMFLNAVHIIVPIGLIVMLIVDVFKKVINPDDKDGQKKILNRIIAAVIVFFVPVLVSFVMKLVDIGAGNDTNSSVENNSCWRAWENA